MAERFVRGWKVAFERLHDLCGASRLAAADVIARSKAREGSLRDVVMTLGKGDAVVGEVVLSRALTELLESEVVAEHAYIYARVLELVLDDVSRPLTDDRHELRTVRTRDGERTVRALTSEARASWIWLLETSYLSNKTAGCWGPALSALALPVLAELWGAPNAAFPAVSASVDWPIRTLLEGSDLERVAAELATVTSERVAELPNDLFHRKRVAEQKRELLVGLETLQRWVEATRAPEREERLALAENGNALLLIMDGDR